MTTVGTRYSREIAIQVAEVLLDATEAPARLAMPSIDRRRESDAPDLGLRSLDLEP